MSQMATSTLHRQSWIHENMFHMSQLFPNEVKRRKSSCYETSRNFAPCERRSYILWGFETDWSRGTILMLPKSLSLYPTSIPIQIVISHWLILLMNFGFAFKGSMTDLEEAISLYCESLSFCHPNRSSSLTSLASALHACFNNMTGSELLFLYPTFHPDRFPSLHNLAIALRIRFQHFGYALAQPWGCTSGTF